MFLSKDDLLVKYLVDDQMTSLEKNKDKTFASCWYWLVAILQRTNTTLVVSRRSASLPILYLVIFSLEFLRNFVSVKSSR